jgi:hypothetical protein
VREGLPQPSRSPLLFFNSGSLLKNQQQMRYVNQQKHTFYSMAFNIQSNLVAKTKLKINQTSKSSDTQTRSDHFANLFYFQTRIMKHVIHMVGAHIKQQKISSLKICGK